VLGHRSSAIADLHSSAAAAFPDGPIGIDLPAFLGCAFGRASLLEPPRLARRTHEGTAGP